MRHSTKFYDSFPTGPILPHFPPHQRQAKDFVWRKLVTKASLCVTEVRYFIENVAGLSAGLLPKDGYVRACRAPGHIGLLQDLMPPEAVAVGVGMQEVE